MLMPAPSTHPRWSMWHLHHSQSRWVPMASMSSSTAARRGSWSSIFSRYMHRSSSSPTIRFMLEPASVVKLKTCW